MLCISLYQTLYAVRLFNSEFLKVSFGFSFLQKQKHAFEFLRINFFSERSVRKCATSNKGCFCVEMDSTLDLIDKREAQHKAMGDVCYDSGEDF